MAQYLSRASTELRRCVADALTRQPAKGSLYNSILERVERDYDNSSSRFQKAESLGKKCFQSLQLFVHRDPQCLECPRCRMNDLPSTDSKNAADNVCQLLASGNRRFAPLLNNGGCNST